MSEQSYYHFDNRDVEVPPILEFTARQPDLARVVVQAAQEKIDKSQLRRTPTDARAMMDLQSYCLEHKIAPLDPIRLGMAILQLQQEGAIELST